MIHTNNNYNMLYNNILFKFNYAWSHAILTIAHCLFMILLFCLSTVKFLLQTFIQFSNNNNNKFYVSSVYATIICPSLSPPR